MTSDSLASIRGRIGGLSLAAQRDPYVYTANARSAFLSRFEREVDPDNVLLPKERARRAEAAKRAYFVRLSYLSAKARRGRQNGGTS